MTKESPYEVLTAYQKAAAVMAATQCGLFEALAEGAKTAGELAVPLKLDVYATGVLLDALVTCGYLDQDENGKYVHNDFSRAFTQEDPFSLANIVSKEWFFYTKWANLADCIRTGKAALAPLTERCDTAPDQVRVFLTALNDIAAMGAPAMLEAAGLPDEGTLLDFGGGMGGYAIKIAREKPSLKIKLVDHPYVCGLCRSNMANCDFEGLFEVEEGDLFDLSSTLGEELFDVVFVSHIIHDYAPDKAAEVIACAAKRVKKGGRMYLLDVPKPPMDGNTAEALFNVMMLVEAPGGRTHEGSDIRNWITSSGLEIFNVSKLMFGTLYEARL